MRIAQVAPLYESVPPKTYGGTERVVAWLTEELVALGHDVTLFASGDSKTSAKLAPTLTQSLRLGEGYADAQLYETLHVEQILKRASEFDIIHFHTSYNHLPIARRLTGPHVITLHGRADSPALKRLFTEFREVPIVSISNAQRLPIPYANWAATIYHGMPPTLLRANATPGEYFAFLGRISPEKRVDRAIKIAKRVGIPLRIAAKIDPADDAHYQLHIKPLLNHPLIQFIGEVNDAGKQELLSSAKALLFPIDWPEPFGLVMIESMACGTPVIAWRCGSVPEVVDHGVTGFIVSSMDAAIEAARQVDSIDRRGCRLQFERRFTSRRMAFDHIKLYERLISQSKRPVSAVHSGTTHVSV